jgi:hypothetical protein
MKKIFPILIISILVLSGLSAATPIKNTKKQSISETIHFSEPTLQEKDKYLSLNLPEATAYSCKKDNPTLPIVTKVYTFPFGTKINTVDVSFSEIREQEITKPIIPSPEFHIYSTGYITQTHNDQENTLTYTNLNIYPEKQWGYRTGAGLQKNDHVIYVTVHLYPTQYYPQKNMVSSAKTASIDIQYTLPENPIIFDEVYDLLIISPETFETALQPLIDHKNSIGIKTILTTLDNIPAVGVDEQESIKYYIKDAIETWDITNVLLVGAGVEDAELFPVRNAWLPSPPHEDYFPSDLYFADIYNATGGFCSWDNDGDGRYAEYQDDLPYIDVYPDVHLGKLPCNNVAEVNTIVDKIINYKAHNKMTKKIVLIGGDAVPGDPEGIYEDEYAHEKVMEKLPGYTPIKLWGSIGELTKSNIGKGFREMVDFVDFSGHGSPLSWATHPPEDETTWIPPQTIISPYDSFLYFDIDLYRLTNTKKLPVVVFTACSNNKYTESPDCIGWKMISKNNGGAIATFAEAGIGYGPDGTDFVERAIGWMEVKVFEELYTTKNLGQVWSNCISSYFNTFELELNSEDYQTMLEFSMFGDPTLTIEDGDEPQSYSINLPFFLQILERLIDYLPFLKQIFSLLA